MSKPCSVCANAQVSRIDAWLKSGKPYREIAVRFGVSKSSVARHQSHLAKRPRTLDEMFAESQRGIEELSRLTPLTPVLNCVSRRKTGSRRRKAVVGRVKTR